MEVTLITGTLVCLVTQASHRFSPRKHVKGASPILITKLYFLVFVHRVLNDLILRKPFSSCSLKCTLKNLSAFVHILFTDMHSL